jgi:rare lipoprotein A
MKIVSILLLVCGALLSFVTYQPFIQTGNASYYSNKFHGRKTASGLKYHKDSMYCAHKTLKYGTLLRVTNLKNDSSIVVKVVDRMGKSSPHIVDLSMAGAQRLNFVRNGIAKVKVEEIIPTVDSLVSK